MRLFPDAAEAARPPSRHPGGSEPPRIPRARLDASQHREPGAPWSFYVAVCQYPRWMSLNRVVPALKPPWLFPLLLLICAYALVEGRQSRNFQFHGKISNHHISHDVSMANDHDSQFPILAEPIQNVTVSVGRDALLACVVDNLRNYKVAWVRVDTQTIISIHHNVITQNPRISLSYTDHRTWYLHIKHVQEIDRGWYMCQVNTDPMRSRQGYLQVVVPPSFVTKETSTDMVVREASNVTLTCKATGYPEPYVMWQREDGQNINYNGESVNVVNGEVLHITKISRLHMGAYLCIAANGVPPRVSTRVLLKVQFPPMLSIPNQLEGAYIGQDVTLECHTEAYPDSINYWTTEHGDMIVSGNYRSVEGNKYEAIITKNGYNQYMKLNIRNVGLKDFGSYKCVAQNSLGGTDGVIKLDEIPAPPTSTHASNQVTYSIRKNGKNANKKLNNRPNDYEVEEWRDPDYNREYGIPSMRPVESSDNNDEDSEDELPSSGALSLATTTGPEVAFSLVFVLFSHFLMPIARS